ncbi:MAG: HD domain-containing phosphohydrolase [Nitrospirota bacterium]|nr:HD domain-containing phosphohydrolase [Nitrospirota bacterium]
MIDLFSESGNVYDVSFNAQGERPKAMKEYNVPDWYQIALEHLTGVALAVQRQDTLDLEPVSTLATALVEALKKSDQLLVQAMSGPAGSPLITNLVNVGIVATKVGAGLGYHGKELERLTFAGLLHDIGLFAVPQSVISKSSRLTHDERMLIEQHPDLGYEAIRKAGPQYDWLAQVVRQAHERWNGQGYPNKLKGRQISEFAQIIGVVDVFDALVSPRGYRRRYFPHEAVRELMVAERTAFPREVMKALVEQLSAYPLGTSVRLTTGEVGTVKHINTNYPLRPIVWIEGDSVHDQEPRQLDLSLTPLVSIVQTLEPPDVARLFFPTREKSPTPSAVVPAASDQFTSLLEGLDALASAIQGAVESKTPAREQESTMLSGERRWTVRSSSQDLTDPSFEKEVIGLFALEAHEWLAQIQAALRQLGEGTHETMRPKLYGILLHGITNLAKSAATVQFHAIEQMASNLLPILHDVGRQEPRAMTAALLSLQEGLDRINVAVRRLAGDQESGSAEQDGLSVGSEEKSPQAFPDIAVYEPTVQAGQAPVTTGPSNPPLLHALRDLQQARARSMQPARDVLEAVISRAEREANHLDVAAVGQILTELDRLDDEFLQEVRRQVPIMSRTLEELRARGPMDFVTASQLDPIVQQVEVLYDMANHVQATMITMFLQGLRSFLMVAAYRKTSTLPQRLETVQGRIHALIPMAEQWVNIGRVERSAIGNILPV